MSKIYHLHQSGINFRDSEKQTDDGELRCLEPRPGVCEMLVKVDKVRANNNHRAAMTVSRVIKYQL